MSDSEEQPDLFEPAPMVDPVAEPPVAPPPLERYPFWGYFDLAMFAVLAIPCVVLGGSAVQAAFLLFHQHPKNQLLVLLPGELLGYLLLFAVLYRIFHHYGRPFWASLAWRSPRLHPMAILMAGFGTAVAMTMIGALIHTPTTENPMSRLLKSQVSLMLVAIFGVTVAPLAEELTFRGFLQPLLARSFGPVASVCLQAIPFGVLHYWEYGKSWRHVVVISLAGAAFGWMRQATGSTMASTLMHSAYNGLLFAGYMAARGGK